MTLINLDLSDKFLKHIEDYQFHFRLRNRAEAIRDILLKGFEAVGHPLDEVAALPLGRPSSNKEPEAGQFVGKTEEVRIPMSKELYFKLFGVEAPEDYDPYKTYKKFQK